MKATIAACLVFEYRSRTPLYCTALPGWCQQQHWAGANDERRWQREIAMPTSPGGCRRRRGSRWLGKGDGEVALSLANCWALKRQVMMWRFGQPLPNQKTYTHPNPPSLRVEFEKISHLYYYHESLK